jgi:hypothetical protein
MVCFPHELFTAFSKTFREYTGEKLTDSHGICTCIRVLHCVKRIIVVISGDVLKNSRSSFDANLK